MEVVLRVEPKPRVLDEIGQIVYEDKEKRIAENTVLGDSSEDAKPMIGDRLLSVNQV